MDASGNIYRAPEDEVPEVDKARFDGYERGKAENELEVSRLLLQVAAKREQAAEALQERDEALAEREETEAPYDRES